MLARASYDEFDLQSRLPSANGNTVGPVSSVAKYLQMRRLRLERTHQEDLDQFMHDFGRSFGNANAAMTEYFRRYKERAVESQAAYRKAKASIMADRNMDYLRKQQAIQRLNPGTEPAWTQELEDAFVRQYGEPREQRMLWNAEMAAMMTETVEEISNFVSISRNRTNWERMVPYLLAHPELDDSVAPCTVIEPVTSTRRAGFPGPAFGAEVGAAASGMVTPLLRPCPRRVARRCRGIDPRVGDHGETGSM